MEFIAAICPLCGGSLQFDQDDRDRKEVFCKYCGNKVLVKQAIELKELNIKGINSAEDFLKNAGTFLKLGEWGKACEAFQKAVDIEPADYRGWWGMVKVSTKGFTHYAINPDIQRNVDISRSLAPEKDLQGINSIFAEFCNRVRQEEERKQRIRDAEDRKRESEAKYREAEARRVTEIAQRRNAKETANRNQRQMIKTTMTVVGIVIFFAMLASCFGC